MKKILVGSLVFGMLCAGQVLAAPTAPAAPACVSFAPTAPTSFMVLAADDQVTATAPDQKAVPDSGDMNQGAMMQNQQENKDQSASNNSDEATMHANNEHATQE